MIERFYDTDNEESELDRYATLIGHRSRSTPNDYSFFLKLRRKALTPSGVGGSSQMKRWHFDLCKTAPNPVPRKKYPILTCPHCNKTGGGAQMIANHFDNCVKAVLLQISP